jgi:hypothetical protein
MGLSWAKEVVQRWDVVPFSSESVPIAENEGESRPPGRAN